MTRKCDQCGKEFATNEALLQHYSAKHPGIAAPKEVRRQREKRKTDKGKKNLKVIVAAVIVLVIIVAVVGVYYSYSFTGGRSTSSDTISPTNSAGLTVGTKVGDEAPNFPITLVNGSATNLTQYRGSIVLLWFVTTWCSSCQQGSQMLKQQYYQQLHSKGVTILDIENYNDLGQSGPSLQQFADDYGSGTGNAGWLYATTTQSATFTYNPQADLDIYYLLNQNGIILTSGLGLPDSFPSVVSAA